MTDKMTRRCFLVKTTAAGAIGLPYIVSSSAPGRAGTVAPAENREPLKPVGEAQGIHPGRVVWVHDPEVTDWRGPEDGHWWENNRLQQERVDAMMARTVRELTGEASLAKAWDRLFRHLDRKRGKGDAGYKPGKKIMVKANWVGMSYPDGHVNTETCTFIGRHDYMNTSPQMTVALLKQLVSAGVKPSDITVGDTLACLVNDYYEIHQKAVPGVRYEGCCDKGGRIKAATSEVPLYWSSRPDGKAQDYLPASFAEAEYVINFANLKAHQGAGVTLCAKNHYGSLIRTPVQQGYYDLHPAGYVRHAGTYRPQVDLMGHAHLGGKTVLYLIDGVFTGLHPRDGLPKPMKMSPFNNRWPCSLFASQDPVAIDSVGFDFLWSERTDYPRQGGVDDYLHEAALADNPPSGTFYDPNHARAEQRLPSLGVHEHWNNATEKKYSRNLGTGKGIELIAVKSAS